MAVTPNSVITAQTPYVVNSNSLLAATACTTRAPTATASTGAANILTFVPVSTNGCRIDYIEIKGASSSFVAPTAVQTVTIWEDDGTNAYPIKEIVTTLVTPSTIIGSYESGPIYINKVLPATHTLKVSTSIATTAATTALSLTATGALL